MTFGAPVLSATVTDASASVTPRNTVVAAQDALTMNGVRWTASWPALVAWGAALLQLALGAGLLTGVGWGAWSGVTGASLVSLGIGGLAWGAVALTRGRVIVPRVGVAAALAGIVLSTAALVIDPERTSILAVAAASALLIACGISCAVAVRSGRVRADRHVGILGLLVAATVVAAVVTPALGSTEAGRNAPDHGGHDIVFVEHGH
ncbi:hypothetical protein ACFM35_15420 [Microbacterium sp. P01]|uniref:hypothetical protein n=1 Tax=Microbacterium sp. P01 TaxID=3366261 RepID=UPI00366E919F